MPCPTVENRIISVFEATFHVKHEVVVVFNIVIQTPNSTISLFRYPSDFKEFHQKIQFHYPRSKVAFPALFLPNYLQVNHRPTHQHHYQHYPQHPPHQHYHHHHHHQSNIASRVPFLSKKSSTLKLLYLFQQQRRKKSNADKIETYLQRCFQHPIISISSLLKDFTSVQREDDKLIEMITNATTPVVSTRNSCCSLYGNHTDHTPTATAITTATASIEHPSPSAAAETTITTTESLAATAQKASFLLSSTSSPPLPPSSSSSSHPPLPPLNWSSTAGSGDMTSSSSTRSNSSLSSSSSTSPPQTSSISNVSMDQFELLKVIGKGCMGKVLLVKSNIHQAPRSLYALKVISKQKVIQQNEIQHTKAERDILTRLRDQPFLIKLHYAFQSTTHLYFVLDYICGGDIATQMSICLTFTKERTQFYAAEILLGLSILHSHGIIYRDLKPENILIGRDGHIVLTDFGLSKVFTMLDQRDLGLPKTGTFCGTAEYLAPEVLLGEQYSYAVDYWSLGTLIYEMLSGMTPFWADTHMEMFRRVLEDNLEFPLTDAFDPVTCDFLSGLLERDAYDRLGWDSSEQIKKHDYFANLDWDDVAQRKLTPPYVPTMHSETDLSHFDASFVNMTPRISQVEPTHPMPSSSSHSEQDKKIEIEKHEGTVGDDEEDPFRDFAFDPRFPSTSHRDSFLEQQQQPIQQRTLRPRPSHQRMRMWTGRERFSTSSSCLSFGTEIPSAMMSSAKNTPSLATSVRKRHSAALSFDCLDSSIHPTTTNTTTTTSTTATTATTPN